MILGITGSREGLSIEARSILENFLDQNDVNEVHHGDCVGADSDVHNLCKERG